PAGDRAADRSAGRPALCPVGRLDPVHRRRGRQARARDPRAAPRGRRGGATHRGARAGPGGRLRRDGAVIAGRIERRWRLDAIAAWAFALRNFQMATRNVFLLFELLFWPIVGVLTIGLMARFLALSAEDASFVLIGQMAFSIVSTCQLDVAYSVLYDFWS